MEAALCNHGLPPMASLIEFLTNSHIEIIFLMLDIQNGKLVPIEKKFYKALKLLPL